MVARATSQINNDDYSTQYRTGRSLRLRGVNSYLQRTPSASASNPRLWTISFWIKRGKLGVDQQIISAGAPGSTPFETFFKFTTSDTLQFDWNGNSAGAGDRWATSAVFRDVSSWYHIVLSADLANTHRFARLNLEVNGKDVPFVPSGNASNSATTAWLASGVVHRIGTQSWTLGSYLEANIAEFYIIDGQALRADSFGQFDPANGNWVPKSYIGTFGPQGSYNLFSDTTSTTTLGFEYSGNGNNWATTNLSLTNDSTYDSFIDNPSNNYCVVNSVVEPQLGGSRTYSTNGFTVAGNGNITYSLFSVGSFRLYSGKWYWEVTITTLGTSANIGVFSEDAISQPNTVSGGTATSYVYRHDGVKRNNSSSTAYGASFTTGDVIGVKLDLDSGTIEFVKNGVAQGIAYSGLTSTLGYVPVHSNDGSATSQTVNWNFGQRPFAFTAPAGFMPISSRNTK